METIKIIIIGDEINIIKKLRQELHSFYSKNIHIVAIVTSITEAYPLLIRHQPDLVFLDLDVPKKNEFELFDYLSKLKFKTVIMTVAEKLTRFKFDIVKLMKSSIIDYFLKPLHDEDLKKLGGILNLTIKNKKRKKRNSKKSQKLIIRIEGEKYIVFANSDGKHIVNLKNLIYLNGNDDYIFIFTENQRKITKSTNLGTYKIALSKHRFYSTHKSHIINIDHVVSYTKKYVLMSNRKKVPISRGRWSGLDDYFNEKADDNKDGDNSVLLVKK